MIVNARSQSELENASLVVGWQEDAGKVGPKVINYLNEHIKGKSLCEIEPQDFFPLDGVAISNNIAQFPISRFYTGIRRDLVIFESNQPSHERYRFLSNILDIGKHYCNIEELYIVSGTIVPIAHTSPRRVMAVFNRPEFQTALRGFELVDMTWEGSPAISSFLLWLAQKRGIPGVSLWPEVAFYLAATEEPKAVKSVLSFFNGRFNLGLDLTGLDSQIKAQSEKIARLRRENPKIDKCIHMLEVGLSLNEEEEQKLVQGVTEFLEKTPA